MGNTALPETRQNPKTRASNEMHPFWERSDLRLAGCELAQGHSADHTRNIPRSRCPIFVLFPSDSSDFDHILPYKSLTHTPESRTTSHSLYLALCFSYNPWAECRLLVRLGSLPLTKSIWCYKPEGPSAFFLLLSLHTLLHEGLQLTAVMNGTNEEELKRS